MKPIFTIVFAGFFIAVLLSSCASSKSNRLSPPAIATQKVGNTYISIKYGQPSLKGRTIGTDVEPFPDSIWRAGANEATVFETDRDVLVEGKVLPKGKYAFFARQKGRSWILIFNKTWDQWGAYKYDEAQDVFRVPVRGTTAPAFAEKLVYTISPDGIVTLTWGDKEIAFMVQEKKN